MILEFSPPSWENTERHGAAGAASLNVSAPAAVRSFDGSNWGASDDPGATSHQLVLT
jgi:hypothetical protein